MCGDEISSFIDRIWMWLSETLTISTSEMFIFILAAFTNMPGMLTCICGMLSVFSDVYVSACGRCDGVWRMCLLLWARLWSEGHGECQGQLSLRGDMCYAGRSFLSLS